MNFTELLRMHDEAWTASTTTREEAANDLVFARITQWDDSNIDNALEYRGQFDMIRKARRYNLSEMRANPIEVSYIPGRDSGEDDAETLEKLYRFDMSSPAAKQATIIAQQDQLDCGYGAWRIVTDYSNSITNEQYIKREPIHEANNRVFWGEHNMPDCSDAEYCSVVWTITDLGWPKFAREIGVDPEDKPTSFRPPEDSFVFPWVYDNKFYNIGEMYVRKKVKRTSYTFIDSRGDELVIDSDEANERAPFLMAKGYSFVGEGEYESYEVRKYWLSGGGVLNGEDGEVIAGTEIPVIPLWGEVSKVENHWHWEGIVRLAKDPQKLRNFMMSYIADIAAKGARQRPYFGVSQIEGLEWQFEEGGPDQNRAFRVLNDVDDDGNPLPAQPMGYEQPPQLPQAAAGLLEACNGSIADVTASGVPMDMASLKNMAEGTIDSLNERADSQTYTYLDNFALALQREAEVYAGMRGVIYDNEREVSLLNIDGTESKDTINKVQMDWETGTTYKENDISTGDYRVRTKVTKAYSARKDKEKAYLMELYEKSQANPAAANVLLMEIMALSDSDSGVVKKFARRNLLQMGLVEPEGEEEARYMASLQQAAMQPDPNQQLIAAAANQANAEAAKQQTEALEDMANAQYKEAQTAEIYAKIGRDNQSARVDNAKTLAEMIRGGATLQ